MAKPALHTREALSLQNLLLGSEWEASVDGKFCPILPSGACQRHCELSSTLRTLCLALLTLVGTGVAKAQLPTLSISLDAPAVLRVSWPSNFTSGSWQLMSTTDLPPHNWQPVLQTPGSVGNALVVLYPFTGLRGVFRLQQIGGAGGGCAFQAVPPVITAGASSTLSWCPEPDTTYSLSPGPGTVSGGSFADSPAVTTVYSLTASNAFGVKTDFATIVVNPCGWVQVNSWDATLDFSYTAAPSASGLSFSVNHTAHITFHLTRQAGSTATDAHYFGFATGGTTAVNDRVDDRTGPQVLTTTEIGSGPPLPFVSYLSLHVTCSSYDFNYNALITVTETDLFGVSTTPDVVGTGAMVARPLAEVADTISDSGQVLAQYPPGSGDYFIPDSTVGQRMFTSGTVSGTAAGTASVTWSFTPSL
jgi:hypothetical protein